MRHALKIRVSKQRVNGGVIACRQVLNACKSVYGVNDARIANYESDKAQLTVQGDFNADDLAAAIAEHVTGARVDSTNGRTVSVSIY